MNDITKRLLERHAADLERINQQRRIWLYASSVVVMCTVFLIFSWDLIDHLNSKPIWWVIVAGILVISVNWWYWTMRVIRILLQHQQVEYDLLHCILLDISEAKEDIKFLAVNSVDSKI